MSKKNGRVKPEPVKPVGQRSAFAQWLIRKRGAMPQEEAADRAKIDRSTWADWERDDAEPRWASVQKLMATYPDWGAPPMSPAELSDPGSKMAAQDNLGAALDRHRRRITLDQADRFRSGAAKLEQQGLTPTVEQWETLLLLFLEDEA